MVALWDHTIADRRAETEVEEEFMADPGDRGNGTGDVEDAERTPLRSERIGAEPRPSASADRSSRGNLLGAWREMNREAGGVGGGLANLTSGEGGCLRRVLPVILILVVIFVVLIILTSIF